HQLPPLSPYTPLFRAPTGWLAARDQRPSAGGTLRVELGGGHVDSPDRDSERWQLAPAVQWRTGPATRRLRVYAERVVTPVWSDLAVDVRPFIQDLLLAGVDGTLGTQARQWLGGGGVAMEGGRRAALRRMPVRDISLRYGWSPDLQRVQDAMVTVAAGVRRGAWALEASGFSRVRPTGTQPSKLDPAIGGRARAETGFRAFANDPRGGAPGRGAVGGAREGEGAGPTFPPRCPGCARHIVARRVTPG